MQKEMTARQWAANVRKAEKIDFWAVLKTFGGSPVADANWQTFRQVMSKMNSHPGHGFGSSDTNHCAVDCLRSMARSGRDVFQLATMSPPDFYQLLKDWYGF